MMIDGVNYCTTIKGKKPTEKQAYDKIMEKVEKANKPYDMTFENASKEYNDCRQNVISPASYREYCRMCERLPKWFISKDIYDITQVDMQKLVNELSVDHKTKTVHNYHGYCVAVITFFRPDVVFRTTFKQNDRTEPFMPSKEQVNLIIEHSAGTNYHIPLQLAKYSMRRSEICALLKSDLDENNYIHVTKALVKDVNGDWIIKSPKTPDSNRIIPIDNDLAEEIRSLDREQIYPYFPESISNYLKRTEKKLGIPAFGIHRLRHFFASELHGIVPESDIMRLGGWHTSSVLRSNYTHSDIQTDKTTQKIIIDTLK